MAQIITKAKKSNRYNMNTAERTINNYIAPEAKYTEKIGDKTICTENENNDKSTWKKILNFIIEVLKLIVTAFLGASGANGLFN